jgi:pilus assembly protein CpaF
MRTHGLPEFRAIWDRALAAPADGAMGSEFDAIFPEARLDSRGRQIEETWSSLLHQLRDPVDTTLRGGLSAGDIAFRLGELVHNYFRTRGVTLTSFELRRIVVALLDNYRRGWPEPSRPAESAAAAREPRHDATNDLVAFVDRENGRPRPPPESWNSESRTGPQAVETPDVPSSLVSVEPRAAMAPAPETTAAHGAPADAAKRSEPAGAMSPAVLGVDAALAVILPVLRQHRGEAPGLMAPRHELQRWLQSAIGSALAAAAIAVPEADGVRLEERAFDALFSMGPLDGLMRDPSVLAIYVNGPQSVFVDRRGRLEPARAAFRDGAALDATITGIIERIGVTPTAGREPLIDRRLADGLRVIIVMPPLAPAGPYLVIRRPSTSAVTLESLVADGAISAQMAAVLRLAVRSRLNVLVSGGPGTGKTGLLAALARAAPADERIVTLEHDAELRPDVPHHVSLVVADESGIGPTQLFAAALALRPDRLLVDGVSETVVPGLVRAIAAGTDGIAATVAAATPQDGFDRLEAALRAVDAAVPAAEARRRLSGAFELVLHLERQRDGLCRIARMADVVLAGDAVVCRDLFAYDQDAGRFIPTGLRPRFMPRVARAGLESAMLDAL